MDGVLTVNRRGSRTKEPQRIYHQHAPTRRDENDEVTKAILQVFGRIWLGYLQNPCQTCLLASTAHLTVLSHDFPSPLGSARTINTENYAISDIFPIIPTIHHSYHAVARTAEFLINSKSHKWSGHSPPFMHTVLSYSPRKPGFDPAPVHVTFVDKTTLSHPVYIISDTCSHNSSFYILSNKNNIVILPYSVFPTLMRPGTTLLKCRTKILLVTRG